MARFDAVAEVIKAAGVVHKSIISNYAGVGIFVFINATMDGTGSQVPSGRLLQTIEAKLLEQGVVAQFVLISEELQEVEGGLRQFLGDLKSVVDMLHVTQSDGGVDVWIQMASGAVELDRNAVVDRIGAFLSTAGIALQNLYVHLEVPGPTRLECLKAVRHSAPVSLEDLIVRLRLQGKEVPSDRWLSYRLDLLRKSGLILRKVSGQYAMTVAGLSVLGTDKSARSPDVSRLLAIARGAI